MQPFSFEIFNLRAARRFLKTQGGYISTISAVCDKDAQETVEALPEVGNYTLFAIPTEIHDEHADKFGRLWDLMREICLEAQVPDSAQKAQPAPPNPPERGEFGWVAQRIYKAGIPDVLPVRSALAIPHDATTEQAFQAIRESMATFWDVPSSTYCNPRQWVEWAEAHRIEQYIVPLLAERMEAGR